MTGVRILSGEVPAYRHATKFRGVAGHLAAAWGAGAAGPGWEDRGMEMGTTGDEQGDFAAREGAVLVAGGTGGIGAAVCRVLAERGCDVALTYRRNFEAASAVVSEIESRGRRARAWPGALEDPAVAAGVVDDVVTEFGAVHTVVYAAGPPVPMVHLSRVSPGQMHDQVSQDVDACFNLLQPILPHLREVAGNIVVVTTVATRRYPVRDGLSAVPKGAVEALVRGLAAEEGRFGVRANCVGPGMLTDGNAERLISSGELDEQALAVAEGNIPLRRFGRADDVAEAVAFLASDRAGYITGTMLDVDGGYHL